MKTSKSDQNGPDYEVKSLSLKKVLWVWIDEKAELMGMDRTEFVTELIAGIAGFNHLLRPKTTMKDILKETNNDT
jgi:hypothetical protein